MAQVVSGRLKSASIPILYIQLDRKFKFFLTLYVSTLANRGSVIYRLAVDKVPRRRVIDRTNAVRSLYCPEPHNIHRCL